MVRLKDTGERLIPEGHKQTLTYGEHISRYEAVLDICEGAKVADIASGTGYGTCMIAEVAESVIGIDYSKEAVAYASEHYGRKNITYKVADATKTGIKDSSLDVVVSLETIEHLKDPEAFVLEVKRILKKDGIFIVSTPNDDEFIEGNDFHIHEFDFAELRRLIDKHFSQKQYYFQGTWFATGIYDETTFTKGGKTRLTSHKTFSQPANTAIFFIAVASDRGTKIHKLKNNNVLADIWSAKRDQAADQARQRQIQDYEDRVQTMQGAIDELTAKLAEHSHRYRQLLNSYELKIGRLLISPLRHIKRWYITKRRP